MWPRIHRASAIIRRGLSRLNSSKETLTTTVPELRLKRGEDRRINAGHPWVFSNEVDIVRTPLVALAAGAPVRLVSRPRQVPGVRLRQSAFADLRADHEPGSARFPSMSR